MNVSKLNIALPLQRVQSTRELVVRYNQLKLQISIKTLPSSIIPHVNMFGVSDIPKTIASDIPKTIVSDIPKTTVSDIPKTKVSAEETGGAHIAIFLKRFKGVGFLSVQWQ